MNLYFDTEFTGLRKNTTLISIGIVSDDDKKFYAEFCDYNFTYCDKWIKENVIDNLILPNVKQSEELEKVYREWEGEGYTVIKHGNSDTFYGRHGLMFERHNDCITEVLGCKSMIADALKRWLIQFNSVQFVSDVCHYDFVLLIDLFGTAFDLPENVNPACVDINQEIARHYGISAAEAFDKSREEIVLELCGEPVAGKKHNSLYDAEVIRAIYQEIVRW